MRIKVNVSLFPNYGRITAEKMRDWDARKQC